MQYYIHANDGTDVTTPLAPGLDYAEALPPDAQQPLASIDSLIQARLPACRAGCAVRTLGALGAPAIVPHSARTSAAAPASLWLMMSGQVGVHPAACLPTLTMPAANWHGRRQPCPDCQQSRGELQALSLANPTCCGRQLFASFACIRACITCPGCSMHASVESAAQPGPNLLRDDGTRHLWSLGGASRALPGRKHGDAVTKAEPCSLPGQADLPLMRCAAVKPPLCTALHVDALKCHLGSGVVTISISSNARVIYKYARASCSRPSLPP